MKKKIFKWAAFVLPVIIIVSGYFVTPASIVLTENAKYSAYPNGLVRLSGGAGRIDTSGVGTQLVSARLFGALPIKTVRVSVVPEREVIVSGAAIGVRLYCDGVMVIEVENDGPARLAGLRGGDIICEVNGEIATSSEQLSAAISGGENVELTVKSRGIPRKIELCGREGERGMKAGMWVRDSAAGIGTMSFFDPQTLVYASLGHPICDSDTGSLLTVDSGQMVTAAIAAVEKGKNGSPGELKGSFKSQVLADISENSEIGVYGILSGNIGAAPLTEIALRQEVENGEAQLLCTIDGEEPKLYSCTVKKRNAGEHSKTQNLLVTVTDPQLIKATGGIVQGMSGSPILQNGKLIGAVTHVLIDDSTTGYGIYAENMLKNTEKIAETQLKDAS